MKSGLVSLGEMTLYVKKKLLREKSETGFGCFSGFTKTPDLISVRDFCNKETLREYFSALGTGLIVDHRPWNTISQSFAKFHKKFLTFLF